MDLLCTCKWLYIYDVAEEKSKWIWFGMKVPGNTKEQDHEKGHFTIMLNVYNVKIIFKNYMYY